MANEGVQYDERGRPYVLIPGTNQRSYISPVAFGDTSSDVGKGETGWHSAGQWNQDTGEVEHPFKFGKALDYGVGGLLGAGVLDALPPLGAAGPPGATIPGAHSAVASPLAISGPGSAVADALGPAAASGAGTTLGMSTGDLLLGGANILARSLASAFAPSPFQRRQGYSGAVEPNRYMSDLKAKLDSIFADATTHLHTPVRSQVDFSGAQPQPLGTFGTPSPQRLPYNGQSMPGTAPSPVGAPAPAQQGKAAAMLLMHALSGGAANGGA